MPKTAEENNAMPRPEAMKLDATPDRLVPAVAPRAVPVVSPIALPAGSEAGHRAARSWTGAATVRRGADTAFSCQE
ncbi:hypothetical protein GCM10009825_19410 [Arthrobacter humicola]|uniref:Uncharacterized protein n=1 Tax=Arthrobacter humicola TaxID=409291 RepID=A0ABN2Z198_9MICC